MAKKRANGEGSIRKRKDGRWEGRYTAVHDPETGKAIYKNVLGRSQAEVKEKLKQAIGETQALDIIKAGKYTVGEWMEVWFQDYAKIKVRPSSHQTYQGYIHNHIRPNIGDIPLEKLTSLDLQKFYKKLLAQGRVDRVEAKGQPKGLSAKTVRNIHNFLLLVHRGVDPRRREGQAAALFRNRNGYSFPGSEMERSPLLRVHYPRGSSWMSNAPFLSII